MSAKLDARATEPTPSAAYPLLIEVLASTPSGAFGNVTTELRIGGLDVRSHNGRDGERVLIQHGGRQHGLRNLLAFVEHLTPIEAFNRREPALAEGLAMWSRIEKALTAPEELVELVDFEEAITNAAVAAFNKRSIS